mmetsp:Transcript_73828/g.202825  ORF Transcript_73828/g.202825 Transcript_73828/m.202825 type:complete len:156 (+) Transcript_73828:530-997(+)
MWMLLQLSQSITSSITTPCSTCRLLGLCGDNRSGDTIVKPILPPGPPCETGRLKAPLLRGACCPCSPLGTCDVAAQLDCVAACLRKAQLHAMGSAWSAPRLVGAELLACADNVTHDGVLDAHELVMFASQCFVPPNAHPNLAQWMETLVSSCDRA